MKILHCVYENILNNYPIPPPEQGGILGMKNGIVCEYYHDNSCSISDKAVYEPDVDCLNRTIEEWDERGVLFAGIIHSHISGQDSLSSDDKLYIELLFRVMPEWMNELYFPIVLPEQRQVISYVAKKSDETANIQPDEVYII